MDSKMLHVSITMVVLSALVSMNSGLPSLGTPKPTTTKPTTYKPTTHKPTNPKPTTHRPTTPRTRTTTEGAPGMNLNGKMFTLSSNGGGITFYPPSFTPTHMPFANSYHPTTPRPRTMVNPTTGVSVCLRYLADPNVGLFTLNPNHNDALSFSSSASGYIVYMDRSYQSISFATNRRVLQLGTSFWTRVCLTVDTVKNVAQVFSDSNMSIRKILPARYIWSGVPVIYFPGFDGQVTDVHVWDYPLRKEEVFNYMINGPYGPYRGSVLTWSDLSYSCRGRVLLEDNDQWKESQPVRSKGKRRRQPKGLTRHRGLFLIIESKRKEL